MCICLQVTLTLSKVVYDVYDVYYAYMNAHMHIHKCILCMYSHASYTLIYTQNTSSVLSYEKMNALAMDYIPHSWSFDDTFRVFT